MAAPYLWHGGPDQLRLDITNDEDVCRTQNREEASRNAMLACYLLNSIDELISDMLDSSEGWIPSIPYERS